MKNIIYPIIQILYRYCKQKGVFQKILFRRIKKEIYKNYGTVYNFNCSYGISIFTSVSLLIQNDYFSMSSGEDITKRMATETTQFIYIILFYMIFYLILLICLYLSHYLVFRMLTIIFSLSTFLLLLPTTIAMVVLINKVEKEYICYKENMLMHIINRKEYIEYFALQNDKKKYKATRVLFIISIIVLVRRCSVACRTFSICLSVFTIINLPYYNSYDCFNI